MANFINLTPHVIVEVVTGSRIEPDGSIARVSVQYVAKGDIGGIPLYVAEYGDIEGLPAPKPDTIYIVSGMVLAALAGTRSDVVAPGDLVRDEAGNPIGCKGFKIN